MVMFNQKVDIDTNSVHNFDIDFFKCLDKFSLMDMSLHWMQVKVERCIFDLYWAPEIKYFIHWVLLEPCQWNCLFD